MTHRSFGEKLGRRFPAQGAGEKVYHGIALMDPAGD